MRARLRLGTAQPLPSSTPGHSLLTPAACHGRVRACVTRTHTHTCILIGTRCTASYRMYCPIPLADPPGGAAQSGEHESHTERDQAPGGALGALRGRRSVHSTAVLHLLDSN